MKRWLVYLVLPVIAVVVFTGCAKQICGFSEQSCADCTCSSGVCGEVLLDAPDNYTVTYCMPNPNR